MKTGIIKQMLTESDNLTYDIYKNVAAVSVITGLFLSVFTVVWQGSEFDMQSFGIGVGSLLAGLGAALRLKPDDKNKADN